MRAELLETPWTWIVMPVEPELARPDDSCALLRISRTLVPVSTFSPPHTALVDHATAQGSPPGTLTALTIARHRPGGPSMCPTTGEPLSLRVVVGSIRSRFAGSWAKFISQGQFSGASRMSGRIGRTGADLLVDGFE